MAINEKGGGQEKQEGWLSKTLNNPDIQRLMAGIGARMDPGGMGEHIGDPTKKMIESKAQQEFMAALTEKMGAGGGKIKMGPDGSLTIDVNAVESDQVGTRLKQMNMTQVGEEAPKETGVSGDLGSMKGETPQRDPLGTQDKIRNLLKGLTGGL